MNKETKKRKRNRLRNKKLLKRYPFLVPVDLWFKKIPTKRHKYDFTMYDDIPKGWRLAFGEDLLKSIRDTLIKDKVSLNALWFAQVKEKYGSLRIYIAGDIPYATYEKVNRIIDDYSHISEYCCIICGQPDVGSMSGWITPICKKCWNKIDPDNPKSYEAVVDQKHTKIPASYKITSWNPNGKEGTIEYRIKDKADRIRARYQ